MTDNLYLVLGVNADAAPEDIQTAYRQLALERSPDRGGAPTPFLELQAAYATLSDSARRRAHDRQLRQERPRRAAAEPLRPQFAGTIRLCDEGATFHPSFEQLFERLWSNFDLVTRPKAEHVENLRLEVPVSREQARRGGRVRVLVPARAQCPACHGRGMVGRYECWECQGHGSLTTECPVQVACPAGYWTEHVVQIPLNQFGIHNFYLTLHFRVTDSP